MMQHRACPINSPAATPTSGCCLPAPVAGCRATTHTDLELRAREQGIPVQVVHNASIMNAVGACGLQLYRFGEAQLLPVAKTLRGQSCLMRTSCWQRQRRCQCHCHRRRQRRRRR